MTERNVEVRLTAEDEEFRRRLREDKALLDSLAKDRTVKIKIDTPSGLKFDKFAKQFDKLSKMVAKPSIEVRGLKQALVGISLLDRELRGLDKRRVTVTVDIKDDKGVRIPSPGASSGGGGGGGGRGGFMNVLGGFAGRFGNWFQGLPLAGQIPVGGATAGIGAGLLGMVSGLIEALVPLLIGGGVGALGIYGASKIDPKAFKSLTSQIQSTFFGSLTQRPGFGGPQGTAQAGKSTYGFTSTGPSFLDSILSLLKQIGIFVGTIGPSLTAMFQASVPYIKMFVSFLEQAAKIMMPAFTQAMKAMTPFLPIIEKGLLAVVQGIAGFIKAMGPSGMKAGAQIFLLAGKIIEGILIALGYAIDFLARDFAFQIHLILLAWDNLRHYTAVAFDYLRHEFAIFGHNFAAGFDQLRHDVAHWWDMLWNNTVDRMIHGQQDMFRLGDEWRHHIANTWDGLRHDVAHWWDTMWNDTIGAAIRFGQTVLNKIHGLEVGIVNEIKKLPGQMLNLGKQALTDLWNGMKAVAPSILGWLKNFAGSNPLGILGILKSVFGINSPSREMFRIGSGLMHGLQLGLQSKMNSVKGTVTGIGGNVVSWITEALKLTGKPMSWLGPLEVLVSKESGGNPRAYNPISVGGEHAEGLFQTLPSTFAAYSLGGSIWNPVADAVAGIRYLSSRYGSPYNIPGLLGGNYQGYWGGGWVNEPVLGVGMQSGSMYGFAEHGPEYVSHGQGGGDIILNIYAHPSNNPDEVGRAVWKTLRDYKRHNGGRPLGLA